MKRGAMVALVLIGATAGYIGERSTRASSGPVSSTTIRAAAAERIDCGNTKRSAKRALRRLVSVQLRSDDERLILPLMARPKRFFAMSVGFRNGRAVVSSRKRRRAARQIAEYGGLRLRINRFMNAERPSRVTDFGFRATWKGRRPAVGKAALDCREGTAIVLGVAIGAQ